MIFFKNLELKDKKILFFFIISILLSFIIDTKLTLFFYGFNEPFKSFFIQLLNLAIHYIIYYSLHYFS